MTKEEFQASILEGIPAQLPAPQQYDPAINHAPKRKEGEEISFKKCFTLFRS